MKRALVVAALASVVALASYLHSAPGSAGCGSGGCAGCACGAGEKTAQISWDATIAIPEEKAADAKSAQPSYTVADLKSAKPLLVYYFVEAIRGRPLSQKAQEIGFRVGFAIVGTLMIFTLLNDTLLSALRHAS